jgi:hypothetical protein
MMNRAAERARQFSTDAIVPKYEALYQAVAG